MPSLTGLCMVFVVSLPALVLAAQNESASTQCLWVRGADVAEPGHPISSKLHADMSGYIFDMMVSANKGHQVVEGKNDVLVLRRFEASNPYQAFTYDKTTILLRRSGYEVSGNPRFELLGSFITTGPAHNAGTSPFYRADNKISLSDISINWKEMNLSVKSNLNVDLYLHKQSIEYKLHYECPLKIVDVSDLSHWQGKVGTRWESFNPLLR